MPSPPDHTLLPHGVSRRDGWTALGLLCALACWPTHAAAQVNRCEHSDGTVAYTDHLCSDIGAIKRAPSPARTGNQRLHLGGCARNVQDLLFEMTTAIDGRDANRLASVYHWAGMSSQGANAVMSRLDAVVRRPLIDIVPVLPEPVPPRVFTHAVDEPPAIDVVEATGERLYPSTIVDTPPVALRVVQTLDNGVTPSETVFGLHRYFGCLWIRN